MWGRRHLEVNHVWAWLFFIAGPGFVNHGRVIAFKQYLPDTRSQRERCKTWGCMGIFVSILIANLTWPTLPRCLFSYSITGSVSEWELEENGASAGWSQSHFPRLCRALLAEEFRFKDNLSASEHFGSEQPCGEESLSSCVCVCVRARGCVWQSSSGLCTNVLHLQCFQGCTQLLWPICNLFSILHPSTLPVV